MMQPMETSIAFWSLVRGYMISKPFLQLLTEVLWSTIIIQSGFSMTSIFKTEKCQSRNSDSNSRGWYTMHKT